MDIEMGPYLLLCNQTTVNQTLDSRFDPTWFFPALLWSTASDPWVFNHLYSCFLGFASLKLRWVPIKLNPHNMRMWLIHCDPANRDGRDRLPSLGEHCDQAQPAEGSGMMLVWAPIHNTLKAQIFYEGSILMNCSILYGGLRGSIWFLIFENFYMVFR